MMFRTYSRFLTILLTGIFMIAATLAASAEPITRSAIILIGDGMGPIQIEIARKSFNDRPLALERTRCNGTVTTESAGGKVTDSAAAATALATGHKTQNGLVGMSPEGVHLESLLERAHQMYKSTGVVTTDALWGGTPAGFLTHVDDRHDYESIAAQLAVCDADIMLGFWKNWFLPTSAGGERTDGHNLIAELKGRGYDVVYTRKQLQNADGPQIIGLFDDGNDTPTLAEMTEIAIEHLSKDPDGFVLMVEGARIDWKCHDHDLEGAVTDILAFDKAVVEAVGAIRPPIQALVLITADHETGGLCRDGSWTTIGHTSTPVSIFAFGPGKDRLTGKMDNTDIPKRIADVIGIGPFPK